MASFLDVMGCGAASGHVLGWLRSSVPLELRYPKDFHKVGARTDSSLNALRAASHVCRDAVDEHTLSLVEWQVRKA